jgi:uncharacterized protein (DUF58 family)
MEGFLDTPDTLDSRQFLIAIKRLADSFSYGTDHSPFLGAGIEYVQSRQYQYGDPIRSIDWRVTARTGRIHVKEYEAPKRMPCWLLIDTSASMAVTSTRRSKYALALHIAGGLGFACLDRVSPVGVLGVGERALRVEPSLSRQQVLQWLLRLRRFRYDETTTLASRIAHLLPSLKNRCLVIVLSDLHDPEAVPRLKHLANAHDVVLVQLRDPAEQDLRGAGFLRAREAETGREYTTHGRARFVDAESLLPEWKRAGIDHIRVDTDRPFAHRLRHFFQSRGLLGRGAR